MKFITQEIVAREATAPLFTAYVHEYYGEFDKDRQRPAILVCPGGGYCYTSPREGEAVALEFFAKGFNAYVLKYSCGEGVEYPVAFLQALTAIKYIRDHAAEHHTDPDKIAISGFSAGGHLAANVACDYTNEAFLKELSVTVNDVKPNALVLSYPVITSGEYAHRGSFENLLKSQYSDEMLEKLSLEKQVKETNPPTFIWHTFADGSVPVQNSLMFATALKEKNIPAELHVFPFGGHGLALSNEETSNPGSKEVVTECQEWVQLAVRFLSQIFA